MSTFKLPCLNILILSSSTLTIVDGASLHTPPSIMILTLFLNSSIKSSISVPAASISEILTLVVASGYG